MHYMRWIRHGDPNYEGPPFPASCSVKGCKNTQNIAKGFCPQHYQRIRRHGDPLIHKGNMPYYINHSDHRRAAQNPEELLELSHIKADTGCWMWVGQTNKKKNQENYGRVKLTRWKKELEALGINTDYPRAHRLSYAVWVGKIPEGAVIHHRCGVRLCINPDHLQAISAIENTAEMFERKAYLKEIRELKKRIRELEDGAA